MSDLSLAQGAEDVLAVVEAALTGATYVGADLTPELAYVQSGPGSAVEGCASVVVFVESVETTVLNADGAVASPPLPAAGCVVVPVANLIVRVSVCVATGDASGNAPTPTEIGAAAGKVYTAGMTAYRALLTARKGGTLPDLQVGTATPTGPAGGMASVEIRARQILPTQVPDGS